MESNIGKRKFNLTTVACLFCFGITIFFLLSSFVAAKELNAAKPENNGAAKYQGTMSGEWTGEVSVSSETRTVSGTFSVIISADGTVSGTYSGLQSGTISGTVTSQGEINAKGSAGISSWTGQLNIDKGRLSGSGTWEGFGGGGSWKSE